MKPRAISSTLVVSVLLLAGGAAAQEGGWPAPAQRWWEDLEAGTSATFEVVVGAQTLTRTIEVEAVDGSRITLTSVVAKGEDTLAKHTETIDVRGGPRVLPDGAQVARVGEETVEVDGRSFACAVFDVTLAGVTRRCWYSADLPPIFSGGNVKQEREAEGARYAVTLVRYDVPGGE